MSVRTKCPSCQRIVLFERGPRGEQVVLHQDPVCEQFPAILGRLDARGGFERGENVERVLEEIDLN